MAHRTGGRGPGAGGAHSSVVLPCVLGAQTVGVDAFGPRAWGEGDRGPRPMYRVA